MRLLDASRAADHAGPRAWAGFAAGIGLGTLAITLLWLGMRAVMAIGGACASGGPYVPAQPCPDGVPLVMMGGMFGLFAGGGLTAAFGARLGGGLAGVTLLGWPLLFLSLGWNFLEFGLNAGGEEGLIWGWLICAVAFIAMGGGPLLLAITSLPAGWPRRLVSPVAAIVVAAALAGTWLGATLFAAIAG